MESFLTDYGYWAILLVLIGGGLGLPIPEEVPLLIGGYLSHEKILHLSGVMGVCLAGVIGGDFFAFFLGWRLGHGRGKGTGILGRVLTAERVETARRFFARYGYLTVILCRFLPGVRTPTFFAAGLMGIPMGRFMLYDSLTALVSVSAFCSLGFVFADNIEKIKGRVQHTEHWLVAIGIAVAVVALIVVAIRWQRGNRNGGQEADGSP